MPVWIKCPAGALTLLPAWCLSPVGPRSLATCARSPPTSSATTATVTGNNARRRPRRRRRPRQRRRPSARLVRWPRRLWLRHRLPELRIGAPPGIGPTMHRPGPSSATTVAVTPVRRTANSGTAWSRGSMPPAVRAASLIVWHRGRICGAPQWEPRSGLRLEFGVPIKIIEPAVVQIVRREQAPVLVQVMHRRLIRHLRGPHPRLGRRQVALAQVTRRARRHHVVPRRLAAARTRDQMIEGEVVAPAAILAGEAVAQENIEPGEGGMRRRLHEALERHDARQLHLEAGAVHRAIVIGDDVHAVEEDGLDCVLPGP